MLDAGVDEDFFTPIAGATLATIFGSQPKSSESPGNETLKYTPPKPQSTAPLINQTNKQDTKATECLLADTVTAHEWHESEYKSRGTLGLAIIKYLKLELCRIILYNSDKTTLSHTTISQTSEFTVKNNTHISYYDDERKYWSVYANENKISLISECLTKAGASIKCCTDADNAPALSEPTDVSEKKEVLNIVKDIESDTDSSINRRTKAAIIQRMAHMGHAVLPSKLVPVDKTSDSSDNNDTQSQPKAVRHKPVKPNYKKSYDTDSSTVQTESRNSNESIQIITPQTMNSQISPSNFGQLMPLSSTSFINTSNNELGLFMSEQRIGNSELRINMNRITDKVDLVLEKISHLHPQNTQQNINTDILMKLLAQYESKIKFYEELLQTKSNKSLEDSIPSVSNKNMEIEELKRKISELEEINKTKTSELTYLTNEIRKIRLESDEKQMCNEQLLQKTQALSLDIQSKNVELKQLKEQQSISTSGSNDVTVAAKIKSMMNELFHTISENFVDEENYTGSNVKKLTGALIKRTTIHTLQEIHSTTDT